MVPVQGLTQKMPFLHKGGVAPVASHLSGTLRFQRRLLLRPQDSLRWYGRGRRVLGTDLLSTLL
jgi:hypothetical protein